MCFLACFSSPTYGAVRLCLRSRWILSHRSGFVHGGEYSQLEVYELCVECLSSLLIVRKLCKLLQRSDQSSSSSSSSSSSLFIHVYTQIEREARLNVHVSSEGRSVLVIQNSPF